jgi:hypothetical protein
MLLCEIILEPRKIIEKSFAGCEIILEPRKIIPKPSGNRR